jgi:hypothetical protein
MDNLLADYVSNPDTVFDDIDEDVPADTVDPRFPAAIRADTIAELVDVVATTERMLASVSAMRADAIDQLRVWSETHQEETAHPVPRSRWSVREAAQRVLVAELACALRIPEVSAGTLLLESASLANALPGTRQALQHGEINYRHAKTLIDQADTLPVSARAAFEESVLPAARTLTVSQFERKARTAREKAHPETITIRHERRLSDRTTSVSANHDGMASLTLYSSADTVHAIDDRSTDLAMSLQGPDEPRTLAQLRADVLADLLIDGVTPAGLGKGVRATVQVTVPVLTLLGRSEEPGQLEGYGPIDPDTARRLAGGASSFTRLLTHPETGVVLSVGKTRYKVPKPLKRWLEVRDGTCRFPGCNREARRSDLDHSLDWQFDGPTDHDNLAHLYPRHHALKSETGWRLKHDAGGTLTWTAPSGRQYATEPATRIRVDAPPVDAPPVDAPPVDAPPVDAPPVDAPPVDAPPADAPPVVAPRDDAPRVESPSEPPPF